MSSTSRRAVHHTVGGLTSVCCHRSKSQRIRRRSTGTRMHSRAGAGARDGTRVLCGGHTASAVPLFDTKRGPPSAIARYGGATLQCRSCTSTRSGAGSVIQSQCRNGADATPNPECRAPNAVRSAPAYPPYPPPALPPPAREGGGVSRRPRPAASCTTSVLARRVPTRHEI